MSWLAGLLAVASIGATAALADDAANQKIIDYYRRKSNLPPEVEVKVTDIKDGKIPGTKTATLTMSRGGQTQSSEVVMSPDGRYVIFGELEDVTADPFKAIAAKIKIDGKPTRGPKDAKVTIVEFSDFQCPYCARAHQTMSDQVMKEYNGKVKLVYKNFPLGFHPWAEPAAVASACAFRQDRKPSGSCTTTSSPTRHQPAEREEVDGRLKSTKINMEKWNDCFDNKKTLDKIKADMAEAVRRRHRHAGLRDQRPQDQRRAAVPELQAVIDDELARSGGKS
jgi:protein-disulfide isomerase